MQVLPEGVQFTVPMIGLGVSLEARPELTVARVAPSAACGSCLEVNASFRVDSVAVLSNETGTMERATAWTASAVGLLELGVLEEEGGDTLLVARPRELDDWKLSVEVEQEGAGTPLDLPLAKAVKTLVGERELRPFPLARLQRDAAVQVRGVRVRGVEGGVVVDQSYAVPRAGVGEAVTAQGWTVSVPAETLLGLAEAAVVSRGYSAEGVAIPRALKLHDGGFVLDVELWRAGGRRPVEAQLSGPIELVDGQLRLSAEVDLQDPLSSLVGGRLVAEIERAAQLSAPAELARGVGSLEVAARVTSVVADDDVLILEGTLGASP